ncbi:type II toxin-antitoxin system RelE family toxin [Nesterenkonia sandarakina]|uniref:mRNA interferase RelE/StbE n=1 Tax=Nesterenkonia sandarakina TaxID=272918 RepID=A0A2T0YAJ2_9MICC|nr:type II toxin-antitoxin system RelE/ParE family toxin [Nesterenkonia sandarakina]PRZ11726.1 mRNA interferase RelE/StbE [Nesterenkonia sandarakina]
MPLYSITYKPSAAKAFRKVHPSDRRRIKDAIEYLAQNPRPQGYVQLSGGDGECRIRVGQYRVVYDIADDELVILVLRIGHRREVYR